jgi:hypothetical protein
MMISDEVYWPACHRCRHYRRAGPWLEGDADHSGETCDAFPEGIPLLILEEWWDHRAPFPDDGGLRFDPIPGSPPLPPVRVRFTPEQAAAIVQMLRRHPPQRSTVCLTVVGG